MPELDSTVQQLHAWIDEHREELIKETQNLLRFNTIQSEPATNAPYGQGNRDALDYCIDLMKAEGMEVVDLEGHIAYGTFGSGERLVMTLGHIDVVPVGPGWKFDPFSATIDKGYIYARGATDDKGPTMASFFALRAIKAVVQNLNSRMRIAFGCNEESGFGCVERYAATEEAPTYGIAPDSGWPCYHAEKGICDLKVSITLPSGIFEITAFAGGQRPNIVVDECKATVRFAESVREEVEEKLGKHWDKNLRFSVEGNDIHIEASGKAAHGSTPFMGDSAATRVLRFIAMISPVTTLEFYEDLLMTTHPSGVGLGITGMEDVTGVLTSNLGITGYESGTLELLFNIRYPVDTNGNSLLERADQFLQKRAIVAKIEIERDSPPLYFPTDSDLVRTIVDVYEAETGERLAPGTMGGGTYARALPNSISIGTGWPGDGDAHQTDERVAIESVVRMTKIYAHLFYRLATMP